MPSDRTSALTRRSFLTVAGAGLVVGCTDTSSLQLVKDSFSLVGPTGSAYPRTRQQVDELAYAQMGVRVGNGARGIMVLAEVQGDELQWISANRIMLKTRRGRIMRSVGLPEDLSDCRLFGPDLLDQYHFDKPNAPLETLRRNIDVGSKFGISILSKFTVEGSETVTILDQKFDTIRVREDQQSDGAKWQHPNRYWLSLRSPLAWRSIQYISPSMAPIEMEMLKRPA
jgi:hypothetical protein